MTERPDPLREFLHLSARDQSAIAKHLSHEERQRLLALKQGKRSPASKDLKEPDAPDWSAYSPWLARHLVRIVAEAEAGRSKLTGAGQAALHACLSQPPKGPVP